MRSDKKVFVYVEDTKFSEELAVVLGNDVTEDEDGNLEVHLDNAGGLLLCLYIATKMGVQLFHEGERIKLEV